MHVSLTGKGHAVQVHLGVRALIGVSLFVIAVVPVEGRVAFVLAHFELTKNIRKKKKEKRNTQSEQCNTNATPMQHQCNTNATTMQQQCNNNATTMQQQCNNNATTTQQQRNNNATTTKHLPAFLATCHIVDASKEHRNTNSGNFTIENQNRKKKS